MVWEPVPSLHIPFLALLACSSSSASLLCSGLQGAGQKPGQGRATALSGRRDQQAGRWRVLRILPPGTSISQVLFWML